MLFKRKKEETAKPKNIADILTYQAAERGHKKYLFFKDIVYTYSQAEKLCNKISRVLAFSGIRKGDRVAVMMDNSPYFIFSVFAIAKAGGIVVPVNTFLKDKEVSYIVNNCEASAMFASEKFKGIINKVKEDCACLKNVFSFDENAESWGAENVLIKDKNMSELPLDIEITQDDTAVIIYTSGTTGAPKGAMLSHGNLINMVEMAAVSYKMTEKDRFLLFLPMFHIYSFEVTIMFASYLGASIIILESVMDLKTKKFRDILIFKRPTVMTAVPSVYSALVKAKMPKLFIKFIYPVKIHLCSGSGLPVDIYNKFKKKFGVPLIEGYGLSEASPVVAGNTLDNPRAGTVGRAFYGVSVKIVDKDDMEVPRGEVGEIIAKGPNIMQGYWKMPKETAESLKNGWFFTGDLGTMDEDGFITIVDRKKDLILVKGMNVYPREIEEHILNIKGVEAAAVISIPDEEGDETILAYIKKDPDANITEKDIKAYLKKNIANFKIPKHVYFPNELPLTTIGKILKRRLKEMVINGEIEGIK
ncbi:MAG: long-chain-fatty-acid--CoA ligase [Candidatus Mucispirillum faecigallinarum]|nr:long-chain-fatty-acid--CoA ligase [Candidatus Mucispirillum faecigallinarum]